MAHLTRRDVLKTGAAAAAALMAMRAAPARAQSKEPIPVGTLCPLTGAGGAYGPDKEQITRVLATNPELIMLLGYTPDSVVMAKELYRAAYKGAVLGPAFAINAKFVEGAGGDVAEGVWAIDPAPSFDSPAYKQFAAAVPQADKNPYAPQSWDHMTLVGLALAARRGEASGTAIKEVLRTISNPPGTAVTSYEDGARLLAEGKKINYEGASGSCDFDAIGDILSRPFGIYQVRKGKIEQAAIINP